MRLVSEKKLRDHWRVHPDSESSLRQFMVVVKLLRWHSFQDVKATYATASLVNGLVVFNIGGNKYRLIADMDYDHHKILVRHILSHSEYDKGKWISG